jgi:hypothetical protein
MKQGQFTRPARSVGSVVDGSVSFSDPEDPWGNLGQTPEHLDAMRRDYERRVAEAVKRGMSTPGYASFKSDAARRRYLSNIVQTVKNQVRNEFNRETRGRELGALERLDGLRKELVERNPPPDWMSQPAPAPTPTPAPPLAPEESEELEGLLTDEPGEPEWEEFSPDSGTLGVPRAAMPQVKGEHRGALVQFLRGRGIAHTQEEVPANSLLPSQAEYSPAKVERARGFDGPPRSILVSSDSYVVDGHHQWLASEPGGLIPVIRLDAPIQQLLIEVARFPSSGVGDASKRVVSDERRG